jgi:hypothetical protein
MAQGNERNLNLPVSAYADNIEQKSAEHAEI